jgi:glycosyltransferase involved in cell wall biosynthesis
VIGKGSRRHVVEALRERVVWDEQVDSAGVAEALDRAWTLVLPSRNEGMGRVILEAFCRNRPVIGSDVGGIADLVREGENGLLVPPQNPHALAEALVRMLSDRELAERLGAGAREGVEPLLATPEEYARRLREIVDAVVLR